MRSTRGRLAHRSTVSSGSRWLFPLLLALCLADTVLVASHLVYADLNLAYPFPGGDGRDWISNGLWWAGESVRSTARPPGLPLILAALWKLGGLDLFPVLSQIVFHVGILGLYSVLRRHASAAAAFATALLFLLNFFLRQLSLEVGADLLAALLVGIALVFVERAAEQPRLYVAAGAIAGVGALVQQVTFLLPLPVLLTVLLRRRPHLRSRSLWLGILLFVSMPGLWFLHKRFVFGVFGDAMTRHWGLLRLHLDGVPYYTGTAAAVAGVPLFCLILAGTWSMLARRRPDDAAILYGATTLTIVLFFALLYDWQAARFLAYVTLPAAVAAVRTLERCSTRGLLVPVSALALLASAAPYPGPAGQAFLVWPLPPLYAVHDAGDGWRFEHPTVSRLLASSTYGRVLQAWNDRDEDARRFDPSPFAGDRSAVCLLDDRSDIVERYRLQYRLGNALLKRLPVVPSSLYPADWWGWRGAEVAGGVDGYTLVRLHLDALPGTQLVVVPRSSDLARRLRRRQTSDLRPIPPDLGAAVAQVVPIDELLTHPDDFVAVLRPSGPAPEWLRLLPFVVRTSSLFVLDESVTPDIRRQIDAAPIDQSTKIGALEVRRVELSGWRTWLVLPQD